MTSKELADRIIDLSLDKKGKDIVLLDIRDLSDIADYFVIVSGESDVHVKSIATFIEKELKGLKVRPWHREGLSKMNWVLLDFVEVVVHIFRPETRNYYDLERLWADADLTRIEDDAPKRILPETTD